MRDSGSQSLIANPGELLVSVVLSFRNEAETIPELIRRLLQVFDQIPAKFELIFVNDNSSDESLELLMRQASKDSRVKIVNLSRRFGYYAGVRAGLSYASGDAVITMDTDLQDPPEVILELFDQWRQGAEVVYTVRTSRSGDSRLQKLITHLAYRVIRRVADVDIPVDAGDYKLMSRQVVRRLLDLGEANSYFRGLVSWVGFRQVAVFYNRDKRFAGTSQRSIFFSREPAKVFWAGITFSSSFPITSILLLGIVLVLFGLISSFGFCLSWLLGLHFALWLWVFPFVSVVSGLQIIATSVVGFFVKRVLDETRNRPQFVVESTFGLSTTN